jgi:RHS repeat-associated protein
MIIRYIRSGLASQNLPAIRCWWFLELFVNLSMRLNHLLKITHKNIITNNVVSATDYYAFGMVMPGRSFEVAGAYRYGFNGKEKEDGINIDNYDFGARIYDGRVGRWLSVDPKAKDYPSLAPYCGMGNLPT